MVCVPVHGVEFGLPPLQDACHKARMERTVRVPHSVYYYCSEYPYLMATPYDGALRHQDPVPLIH